MTTVAGAATSTATGPTVRSSARSARGPVLALVTIVVLAVLLGLLSLSGPSGRLDPDSYAPAGSRAVAELLRDGGVDVRRLDSVDAVEAADGRAATVVVPVPDALAPAELQRLGSLAAALVVVEADDDQLDQLEIPAEARRQAEVEPRQPACEVAAARAAGEVDLGGVTYRATGDAASAGCYASSGDGTLLQLPERRATLLGDGTLLTNDALDRRGNAALALGVLAGGDGPVLWLVPRPGRAVEGGQATIGELLPDGVLLGVVQLTVAVCVLALWRARRLGRVVEEPLPVVVRAAEAVEGRSRLYRAAGARDAAAEALRAAARERLLRAVRLPTAAERHELVTLVAQRCGEDATRVDALLYGEAPVDDAALVRLADDLRTLEQALARST